MARNQTFERKNIYRDFDLGFTRHPLTNDIGVKTDVNAINQSLRTLIYTNFYERPFQPEIGSNIRGLLFELADPITIDSIRQAIEDVIFNYEPRVDIQNIIVLNMPDYNAYNVSIVYTIPPFTEAVELDVTLERLR